ncbi:MAG: hypothetical protein F6K08_29750 [Okeania sp. SIO1H6]|nr:hypothetical protein [Okeania sp. SIO1H6]
MFHLQPLPSISQFSYLLTPFGANGNFAAQHQTPLQNLITSNKNAF